MREGGSALDLAREHVRSDAGPNLPGSSSLVVGWGGGREGGTALYLVLVCECSRLDTSLLRSSRSRAPGPRRLALRAGTGAVAAGAAGAVGVAGAAVAEGAGGALEEVARVPGLHS